MSATTKPMPVSAAPAIDREVLELELGNKSAQFDVLEKDCQQAARDCRAAEKALHASPLYLAWKALDEQLAIAAVASRQCGERVRELERKLGKTDDYTNGDSHVKVGT